MADKTPTTHEAHGSVQNENDLDIALLGVISAVSVLLLIATVVAVQAWFYNLDNAVYEQRVVAQPHRASRAIIAYQQDRLNEHRWIDRDAGIAAIPIDQAMRLYVERGEVAIAAVADSPDDANDNADTPDAPATPEEEQPQP